MKDLRVRNEMKEETQFCFSPLSKSKSLNCLCVSCLHRNGISGTRPRYRKRSYTPQNPSRI
ncbi:hypothetical protein Bca52824_045171 [Brassica carinata]|uniref:Uncharacterized protein n=1 Tax=Brassica carinata TaxID=52824 RepID=A0A8X7RD88_BRACI|nr:hypothetical protein Bca52824_045171 [Brassica carinata]